MAVILKVLPIFLLIGLGLVGRRWGLFPPAFIAPANRLAYYFAIPALLFRGVAKAPVAHSLQPTAAGLAMVCQLIIWGAALLLSRRFLPPERVEPATRASWVHCSVHGNLGLVGLAVVSFALGEAGVGAAGLMATVIIVTQNALGVFTLTRMGSRGAGKGAVWGELLKNPIIWATIAGLAAAAGGVVLPEFLDRTLALLAGLGVPLALMIVGAKMGEARLDGGLLSLGGLALTKLIILPALGLGLATLAGLSGMPRAVLVLLLAAPTATLTVVLAGELGGDVKQASHAVTVTHALCALTYPIWLAATH